MLVLTASAAFAELEPTALSNLKVLTFQHHPTKGQKCITQTGLLQETQIALSEVGATGPPGPAGPPDPAGSNRPRLPGGADKPRASGPFAASRSPATRSPDRQFATFRQRTGSRIDLWIGGLDPKGR